MEPKILGRYEIRGVLGRGNMGVVYRAHDPVIDRPVAVKTVVLPDGIGEEDRESFLKRFFYEARAAGRLVHANVVVTHDAATDEATKTPFIVMELVDGETLSSRLSSEAALPWQEAVRIARAVASALGEAHQAGIVHRDIKPGNIMLTASGMPKITDFGIAKVPTAKLTQEGAVLGTPYYMSPEQLKGEAVDGRSDLFSLGAVLYCMLAGRPPFAGEDAAAIFSQVLYVNPPPIREVRPELPESLERVVARALSKPLDERHASAGELVEDLDAVLANRPPVHAPAASGGAAEATRASGARRVAPKTEPPARGASRRAPALAGLAVILLVVLFAFRSELAREKGLWEAREAVEEGQLESSEASLERLVEANPDFGRARSTLADVSKRLLEPRLPMEITARHHHTIGNCTGTLTFYEDRIEFASPKHALWSWAFERVVQLASPGEWSLRLQTNEGDLLGLLETKNYNFSMRSAALDRDFFKRYLRIYEAARSSS